MLLSKSQKSTALEWAALAVRWVSSLSLEAVRTFFIISYGFYLKESINAQVDHLLILTCAATDSLSHLILLSLAKEKLKFIVYLT